MEAEFDVNKKDGIAHRDEAQSRIFELWRNFIDHRPKKVSTRAMNSAAVPPSVWYIRARFVVEVIQVNTSW